ncbi:MAG: DUF5337 domain-containing protein [Pelagimonas sp.]|jgi:predicted MFS family arabinose efflux permease|nr:DUF5337 domain-containing protein [Pelagimonas sp.]
MAIETGKTDEQKRGRQIALVIAGAGFAWILANILGTLLGVSHRFMALFDLAALAAFVWAIWMVVGLWRERKTHKD